MKPSTRASALSLIIWLAFETPIAWGIWNRVVVRVFGAPRLAYWEVMVLLVLIGCIFPDTYSLYLGKIADKLYGHEE